MTAKQYLRQARRIDSLIKAKQEQIKTLRDLATCVTMNVSPARVQGGSGVDKVASTVAKLADLEMDLTKHIEELAALQREITRKIDAIQSPEYRLLLTLRYLDFRRWEEIAVEMHYNYQWVHRLHNRALQEFDRIHRVSDRKR